MMGEVRIFSHFPVLTRHAMTRSRTRGPRHAGFPHILHGWQVDHRCRRDRSSNASRRSGLCRPRNELVSVGGEIGSQRIGSLARRDLPTSSADIAKPVAEHDKVMRPARLAIMPQGSMGFSDPKREGRMSTKTEYQAGAVAPASGTYEQLSIFGSPTGTSVWVEAGDQLPPAPRGCTWRLVSARAT
jgi:hypothetical protein